ncbi:hypothetical protein ES288_A07G192900v1 [Gossypium darwinii]|uniref:Serine/threonine-protein phosphatase 4 regulatory subunit 3-like central domain-containing protein n=1 Tax=Gossypium darwinii TaxID=34276 RepID=A0A5D2FX87_GOSDA|nr:hypothetical protein ES288_A07G192900v1 [Gossypium darwinii]
MPTEPPSASRSTNPSAASPSPSVYTATTNRDHICNVQQNIHFSSLNSETFHSMNSELRELPAVELSTLAIILKTVIESGIANQMRLTELILNDKLMELFRICEDLENMDGLHMIFKIVKGIILLNSAQIFEKIFGDELIMDIIGSLELEFYRGSLDQVKENQEFCKKRFILILLQAVPIKNPMVISKIHQAYRVGYLKDVVLARLLDEATVASLNSMIHSNNAIVISLLKDDSTFIQELFARLRSPTTSAESKKNLEKPTTLDCSPRTICRRHIMAGSYFYKCIWEALQQRIRMILINMQLTPYVL